MVENEDVNALLQSYTLCAPSQNIYIRALFPPFNSSISQVLEEGGYAQLTKPINKAGRSVLFWVEGYQPSTRAVEQLLADDGRDRGILWSVENRKGSVEPVKTDVARMDVVRDFDELDEDEQEEEGLSRRELYPRWVISFEDEKEARRFIRVWQRQPFPIPSGKAQDDEPPPLVYAEFLW